MILNIYKPVGWTSADVVRKVKKITQEKKVGHGGTLDPFAEGVLIIGSNKDTKKLTTISSMKKSYEASLQLGCETDTQDVTGNIIIRKKIPDFNEIDIKNVFNKFLGQSTQVPPAFSAKKINGVRSYKLARQGKKIEHRSISITIYSLELLYFDKHSIQFFVESSKGTYIRVLGQDIARSLNTAGYLKTLKRTSVGDYSYESSKQISELESEWKHISN